MTHDKTQTDSARNRRRTDRRNARMAERNPDLYTPATVTLPAHVWSHILADLNIARGRMADDGMDHSAESTLRLGAEICRQLDAQGVDEVGIFAGRDVNRVEPYR